MAEMALWLARLDASAKSPEVLLQAVMDRGKFEQEARACCISREGVQLVYRFL